MKNKSLIIIGGILIVLAPLRLLTGTAYTLMLPNIFEGNSVLQLTFPQNNNQQYTKDALIALTKQKAELIRTTEIYSQVITQCELNKIWGHDGRELPPEITRKILDDKVKLDVDTEAVGLIRVTVESTDPEEAAEISNAISNTFRQSHPDISIIDFAHAEIRPVSPDLFKEVISLFIQAVVLFGIGTTLLVIGIKKKSNQRLEPIASLQAHP